MLEELFFLTGLANSLLLIAIFLLVKGKRMDDVKRVGLLYLGLAVPALYGLYLVAQEQKAWQYGVFLGIFLAFLALEALYDFILRLDFRNSWKLVMPYGALYIAMNYGFVVMVWKYYSQAAGILMLGLAIVQIGVNIWASHPGLLRRLPGLRHGE